ncbi:hypothetical protein E4U46_001940 [Claviceps purpurea]|nr:hypothetical protein E4U46_001940 [Claviceps purpurea]
MGRSSRSVAWTYKRDRCYPVSTSSLRSDAKLEAAQKDEYAQQTSVLHQSQQKEVNLEDIEKMKVEEDDSDSEDEGSLGQPALPQEQTLVSLGALESYLHDVAVPLGFDVARSKWYGRKNEASGKMSRLYFRCCRGSKQDCRRKVDS